MKNWILRVYRKLFAKKTISTIVKQEQKSIDSLSDKDIPNSMSFLFQKNYKILANDYDERKNNSEGKSTSSPISR
jgi:hypothetical protein